jgi:hypothetical protein
VIAESAERGARGEAEEFVSSEAPTSITRLTENINKAVIANDGKTRGVRGRKLVEEPGDGIYCKIRASFGLRSAQVSRSE